MFIFFDREMLFFWPLTFGFYASSAPELTTPMPVLFSKAGSSDSRLEAEVVDVQTAPNPVLFEVDVQDSGTGSGARFDSDATVLVMSFVFDSGVGAARVEVARARMVI